jgi:hypothetical protein
MSVSAEEQHCVEWLLEMIADACCVSMRVQAAMAACRKIGMDQVLGIIDLAAFRPEQVGGAEFLRSLSIAPDIFPEGMA